MRQRNDTNDALYVPCTDPPFVIEPGAVVEWPSLIVGLTVLPDDSEQPKPARRAGRSTPIEEPS